MTLHVDHNTARPDDHRYVINIPNFTEENVPEELWNEILKVSPRPGKDGPGKRSRFLRWPGDLGEQNWAGLTPLNVSTLDYNVYGEYHLTSRLSEDFLKKAKAADENKEQRPFVTLSDWDLALEPLEKVCGEYPDEFPDKDELSGCMNISAKLGLFRDRNSSALLFAPERVFEIIHQFAGDLITWRALDLPTPRLRAERLYAFEIIPKPIIDWFKSDVFWAYMNAGYGLEPRLLVNKLHVPALLLDTVTGRHLVRDALGVSGESFQFISEELLFNLRSISEVPLKPNGVSHWFSDRP